MWPQTFISARIVPILFVGLWSVASAQITFVRHDITTELRGPYGLHAVDMDSDGRMDILLASTAEGVSWWRNRGNGSFERHDIDNSLLAWFVHGADVDGDGDIDVAAALPNPDASEIRLWINQGGQSWGAPIIFPILNPEAVHAADLNRDGIMEILGVSWAVQPDAPGSDLVYFKNYLGQAYTRVMVDPNLLGAHCVASADFNDDGKIDIIGSGAGDINIYLNEGSSFYGPIKIGDDGATGFSLADVDGDGDLDVVTQPRSTATVAWHENQSNLNFATHIVGSDMGGWSTHAVDLGGDGDVDITAAGEDQGVIKAYLNDGFQDFTEVTVVQDFPYTRFEYPMDVDNDGDADIVGVSVSTNTLAWFESVVPIRRTLQITSPNGGEIWEADSTKKITWKSTGAIENVKIELSTDGGSSWGVIVGSAPNTGTYSWKVPKVSSSNCSIRISDVADSKIMDQSNASFSIVPYLLRLTSPNGGENWLMGTTQTITWLDKTGLTNLSIELSTNGGTTWQTIATNAANTGSYSWKVPGTPSTNCRIRISDAADGIPFDVSDASFTIVAQRLLTITSPNGGENWFAGASQNLTWNTSGSISSVKLEFSLDRGGNWQTIVASVSNTGSYLWKIPAVASITCLVRISDTSDLGRFDVSDNVFSIAPPFISVASPNGSESLLLGSSENLTWKSGGPIEKVKIELSRNGGSNWNVLTTGAANDGSFTWAVSGPLSGNCLLRISDALDGLPTDVSDAPIFIDSLGIRLSAPNGGETLTPGEVFIIKWKTNPPLSAVKLEYSLDDGLMWIIIAKNNPDLGSFGWVVPNKASNTCRVRISDVVAGGASDISDRSFRIKLPNRSPTANAGGPYRGTRNVPVVFNASQSSDPDGDPLTFAWSFGDGQPGTGIQPSHTYSALGTYTATLTVRDGQGGEAQATAQAQIYNTPPIVDISANESGVIAACSNPYSVKFTINKAQDIDGTIKAYAWNFGDGSPNSNSSNSLSHNFQVPGVYTIRLTVTDNDGATAKIPSAFRLSQINHRSQRLRCREIRCS
jgi:chitodextrinase